MNWRTVAVILALVASGCADSDSPDAEPAPTTRPESTSSTAPADTTESSAAPTSASTAPTTSELTTECGSPEPAPPRAGLDVVVHVALFCGPAVMSELDLRLAERVVPDDGAALAAALTQLLLGTTPDEAANGLQSAFSAHTAGQINAVDVRDGVAIIDLSEGFVRTNNFSTSNLAGVVGRQIEATVYEHPGIDGIDFRVNGERWCWWESTCDGAPNPLSTRASSDAGPAPSQDPDEAARDHVVGELAALPYTERVGVLVEAAAAEGVWTLSRIPTGGAISGVIGDPDGDYPTDFVVASEYGEILLLDGAGHIARAFPMPGAVPSWIVLTDAAVFAGRIGDGGLPDSTLVRIDRTNLAAEVLVIPAPFDGGTRWPAEWAVATPAQVATFEESVGFAPESAEGTPADSWIGDVVVEIEALDALFG